MCALPVVVQELIDSLPANIDVKGVMVRAGGQEGQLHAMLGRNAAIPWHGSMQC